MPNVDELIQTARELQSLVTKRRRLRRQLRAIDADILHKRKMLAGLKAAAEGRRPDVAPSRLTNGATGLVPVDIERVRELMPTASFDLEPILCTCGHRLIEHDNTQPGWEYTRCLHDSGCTCKRFEKITA